jgi:hypothetical protein
VVLIGCAVVIGSGLLYMLLGRPYERSDAPAGDAASIRGGARPEEALA